MQAMKDSTDNLLSATDSVEKKQNNRNIINKHRQKEQ